MLVIVVLELALHKEIALLLIVVEKISRLNAVDVGEVKNANRGVHWQHNC